MPCTGYKAASDKNGLPARPWDTAHNSVWLGSHESFCPLIKHLLEPRQLNLANVIERNMHTCHHSLLSMFLPSVAVINLL